MKKLTAIAIVLLVSAMCFGQAAVTPVFKKYVVNSIGEFGDGADITDTLAYTAGTTYLPTFVAPNGYVHYNFYSILASTDSFVVVTGSAPTVAVGKKPVGGDTLNITWIDSSKVLTAAKTDIWPVLNGKPSAVLAIKIRNLGATSTGKTRRFIIEAQ